jgi:hypothetical protein
MIANLPTWIVNIFCRGGFQHRESFVAESGARDAVRLAKQLEFVIDVEIVPPMGKPAALAESRGRFR